MKVQELTRYQLLQLKQTYLCQLMQDPPLGTLVDADKVIPDDIIFDYYAGIDFVEDDFSST